MVVKLMTSLVNENLAKMKFILLRYSKKVKNY